MIPRRIAAGALLLAVGLGFIFSASSVLSCVPNEQGKCEAGRAFLRVGSMGGGKGNATLILETNAARLKADLGQFLYAQNRARWALEARRLAAKLPREMSDLELARAKEKLYADSDEESLSRLRRLRLILSESNRRAKERALELIRKFTVKAVPKPVQAPHVPAPAQPGSADPYNAPAPTGNMFYIGPQTSVWFNISDRGRRLTLWMDVNKQSGLTLAIFGPDQANVWDSRPVGQAAPGEGHDFFWTGRSRFKGIWRLRITNQNDFSVPYTLTATAVSDKDGDLCRDCHGIIEDEWERCEHEGSFCEDLKEQYAN